MPRIGLLIKPDMPRAPLNDGVLTCSSQSTNSWFSLNHSFHQFCQVRREATQFLQPILGSTQLFVLSEALDGSHLAVEGGGSFPNSRFALRCKHWSACPRFAARVAKNHQFWVCRRDAMCSHALYLQYYSCYFTLFKIDTAYIVSKVNLMIIAIYARAHSPRRI